MSYNLLMRNIQFSPGYFYHIYNRGTDQRDIFLSDADRWRFLQGLFLFNDEKTVANLLFQLEKEKKALNFNIIREFLAKENYERKPLVKIFLDCLKPNHFHLLLEEISNGGISRFMHKIGAGYTCYFNRKYQRSGHLFQGAFRAVKVENDDQFRYLAAYINVINPVQEIESGIKNEGVSDIGKALKFAEEYPWSTHREYLGLRESIIIDKNAVETMFSSPQDYQKFISDILEGKKKLGAINNLILD